MSGKAGAYGTTGGGDTDFRKQYDREAAEKRFHEREKREREEAKQRYQAKLEGRKWHREATPPDVHETEARASRLDFRSKIGTTALVQAGAGVGKRGKGAGFYCEACDLTYRDSQSLVEHYNSIQHLRAIGQSTDVKRATVAEVRARLRWLSRKRREAQEDQILDLDSRLQSNRETQEKLQEEKRRKRNEKRRAKKRESNAMVWNVEGDGVIS